MSSPRIDFGIFLAPFHPVEDNPTLAFERDLELIEWLDRLGYDEAWIGEHHSAGYEIIGSPEVFIAAAAQRTRRIRLGTGVVSLPYHHPLIVADRAMQLDHMTRGRAMLGVGPGALPSDAFMMGIDTRNQRRMMEESLDAILRLLAGETVTMKTDWFELVEARLQLAPYSRPHLEVAVAAMVSPSGPRAAGRFGCSLLSIGATSVQGFEALRGAWAISEELAARHGKQVDRRNWRLVGPMHIAESREKARENVRFGLERWIYYFQQVAALPLATGAGGDPLDAMVESGLAVIGTPEDAIAQIERLQKQSGGFGCVLQMAHEWADREATLRSYELFARYVMPAFQGANERRRESMDWAGENRERFVGAAFQAIGEAIQRHADEQQSRAAPPRDER
jgi:limonene 1,2-monooxygenase